MDTNNNENLEKEVTTTDTTNTEVATPEVKTEEVKEEVVAAPVSEATTPVEEKKAEKPKKKSNTLAIIICIIGVICLGIGVFLTVTNGNSEDTPVNESGNNTNNSNSNNNNNANNNNNTNTSVSLENIKNYIEYNNFEMKTTVRLVSTDMTIDMVEDGKYDALNNVYFAETSVWGMYNYEYYDINNHVIYSSEDKTVWSKETDEEIVFPTYPNNVISKVKANDGVTDLGNGSYSLNVDASVLPDMDGMSGDVPTTATFDSNGYLTKVVFDLKSLSDDTEGISEYSITLEFSNVNGVGTVSIPEDVVSGATEDSEW